MKIIGKPILLFSVFFFFYIVFMGLFSYSWKFNIEFGYHTDETTRIDRIIVSQPTDCRRYLQVLYTEFYSFGIIGNNNYLFQQ